MDFRPAKSPAQLKPYIGREPLPIDYMTFKEFETGGPRMLIVDTESYPNYFLAAFRCVQTGKVIAFEISPDSNFNTQLLSRCMLEHTTIGFNSHSYDLPIIWYAIQNPNAAQIKEVSNSLIGGMVNRWEIQKEYNYQIHYSCHIDLIEVCPLRGSLKTYGARLHSDRVQDLPFHHMKALSSDEAQIVKQYCINNDLPATLLVYSELSSEIKLRAELSAEYRQDLLSKSDPQLAEAIITSELTRLDPHNPPKKPKAARAINFYHVPHIVRFQTDQLNAVLEMIRQSEFEVTELGGVIAPKSLSDLQIKIGLNRYRMGIGGLHSCEKAICYVSNDKAILRDRDVRSYYPKIILNLGLAPKHLGANFLHVYNSIFLRRLAAKDAGNAAVSEALKIAINGCFGKLGSPYSVLYSPDLMVQVTVTGQLCLLMLIEAFELAGIPAITANTDGIVCHCPIDKMAEYDAIIKQWELFTGFETEETRYMRYLARDVNNYLAVKEPDKSGRIIVKGKGAFLNPWHGSQDVGKLGIFRFHKNPMTTICIEAVIQHIVYSRPIHETILASRDIREFVAVKQATGGAHKDFHYLGKVVRWYYAKGAKGSIQYVNRPAMVAESEGAKPLMDLPAEFPSDINYDWYVAKTQQMLEDLAFYQKQPTLF